VKRIASLAAILLVICLLPTGLIGWGREGHSVIAALAERHLTPNAKLGLQTLLGGESLTSIASWADDIRPQRDETYNWHFVDIPKSATSFDEQRDCFRPDDNHAGAQTDHHNCVVDRIGMFKQALADQNASPTDRAEALKFIVHFIGDVHQPFHAIGDARGANGIRVNEFGSSQCGSRPCNLHSAWDDGLIAHSGMNQRDYVTHLEQLISDQHLTASGDPQDWANESHKYAQDAWLDDGSNIDESYYNSQIKVIDQRMALAGLRLAALLNDVFTQSQPQAPSGGVAKKEAEVTRNANLRPDPSSAHAPIEKLHLGDEVELVELGPVSGYYHVTTEDGREGWVSSHYVDVKPTSTLELTTAGSQPASDISENWGKPTPNKTTLTGPDGNCPWNGNNTDPDTYARKNRSDVPTQYHDVDFSAIHDLPFPNDKPIRANWSPEHLAEIARYEGVPLRTIGYLVAFKPQNGHGEGTNCGFTLASETDTHMALVGEAGDAEKNSVVIEFTPRFLKAHAHWSKTFLSKWLDTDTPVRISGWLLLDPDHRNHLNKFRYTLWEIHPITKIEVFENNQWKDIDQLQ